MSKFKLAFGLHNHQPVGNFDSVFEQAHRDAYAPFLELMEKFPHLRLSIHQSGILWEWQRKADPSYFKAIRQMVERGQVELLTGGFYEPILTAIPERDVHGQIGMLTEYLHRHFGVNASGLWLTERVWEPHLAKTLANAKVKFLPVDDTHFLYAGFQQAQLTGPFITEHEGHTVTLLPIQKRLRYLIPFGTVDEVIAELRTQAERNPDGLAVYADDGEKFGVWPKTHQHCFGDKWLEQFFSALERNADWLEVIPLGEAAAMPTVGRAYLPSASYAEMLHWSLPAQAFLEYENFEHLLKQHGALEQYGRFVRGGHWRGFLAKYEESNLMHKKMLAVSKSLEQFESTHPPSAADKARDSLYASQCNCPYWHGVFGGLYLPHIRQAVYGKMIEAEEELRRLNKETGVRVSLNDYDADGHEEILVSTDRLSAVLKPNRGGSLVELSLLKEHFNLTDTLSRRKEGYHLKLDKAVTEDENNGTASIHDLVLAKEAGLKSYLVEDWYLKRCCIDHVLSEGVGFEQFQSGSFGEDGDFVLEPYRVQKTAAQNAVVLIRDGLVRRPGQTVPLRIKKQYTFEPDANSINVRYELSSPHGASAEVTFAVENSFNFQAGHAYDRYLLVDNQRSDNAWLDAPGCHARATGIAMVDEYRNLAAAVVSDRDAEIWHLPIFTVSLSEGGFEKVYQGTTLVHVFKIKLSESPVTFDFSIHAGPIAEVLREAFAASSVSAQ